MGRAGIALNGLALLCVTHVALHTLQKQCQAAVHD